MMLSLQFVALMVAAPSLVSAAMFPKGSQVKVINEKGFRQAMRRNETSLVSFVAPWCGHCQKMAPEYAKAALGLHPLIPAYAVNCDLDKNKPLCSEQGVQGFPTVKLYPRGRIQQPITYNNERTASGLSSFATRGVPNSVQKLSQIPEIMPWARKNQDKPRLLLLTKDKKVPLLWKVLANKYSGKEILFGLNHDLKGQTSVEMGLDAGGEKESKILLYPNGSQEPLLYRGVMKYESLTKFIGAVLDGTVDLEQLDQITKSEESTSTNEEPTAQATKPLDNAGVPEEPVLGEDAPQVILQAAKEAAPAASANSRGQCASPGADSKVEGCAGHPKDEL